MGDRGTNYVYYDDNSAQHLLQGMVFAELEKKKKNTLAGLRTFTGNITDDYSPWNNFREEEREFRLRERAKLNNLLKITQLFNSKT